MSGDEDEINEVASEDEVAKWSCNVIRSKLRRLFTTEGVVQSHWLKENHINNKSYGNFMKLKGAWNGTQNGTMWAATRYFLAREKSAKKGKTSAGKRKREDSEDFDNDESEAPKKPQKRAKVDEAWLKKIREIDLDDGSPVYDDCSEVRRKINAYLRQTRLPKSALCKMIKVTPKSFDNFMVQGKHSRMEGSGSSTYPNAYKFFERQRILEGKPKSKKRLEEEASFSKGHSLQPYQAKTWYLPPGVHLW